MNEYEAKLKEVIKGRVVVYIDAANLERSVKSMFVRPDDISENLKHFQTEVLRWSVDYRKLNDFFKTVGDFQEIRFYTTSVPLKIEQTQHIFNTLHMFA